jgi:hypothetical protein
MVEKAKTEEIKETPVAWPSRIIGLLTSMPLSLKLGLLVLITLIPRLLAFLQPQIITIDGTLYVKMAKLFSDGKYEGISNTYFTLYPLMLFFVQKFVGDWELSGRLISLILGTLTVIPIFLLGRSLYNERVGWLSAFFYITLPNFLRFDTDVLRDPTYWFFLALTLWLTWEGLKKNRLLFMGLASISAGFGAITRVDGFILWGVLALYVAFCRTPRIPIKRKALNVAILVIIFPILLSPILLSTKRDTNHIAVGEMTSFSINVIRQNMRAILRPGDPIARINTGDYKSLPPLTKDALELGIRHRSILAFFEVIYKFIKSANLLIVLILLGLWKRKREGFESPDWYLVVVFTGLFIISASYARQIYYFSTRHGLTLVLPCFFFAGHGLDFIAERFSRGLDHLTSRWNIIKKYLVHFLTLIIIILFLAQGLSFKRSEKFIQKEIGVWLKEKGYQGSVIMGPKQLLRLAFYADGKFVELPDSWEKAMESIPKNGVRILIIDSCTIAEDCPSFLANWSKDGFLLIREIKEAGKNCLFQIYSVR